jgi:four helix bundle protein
MKVKKYSELIAWQKAMDLVESVYKATASFPREEIYGLTSQVRRAAVSVPSNIAEGQGRKSTMEFLHHLSIAYGSLTETETQLLIAGRLAYLEQKKVDHLIEQTNEVGRLLNGLSNSLSEKQRTTN